jgi:hypothetical protein
MCPDALLSLAGLQTSRRGVGTLRSAHDAYSPPHALVNVQETASATCKAQIILFLRSTRTSNCATNNASNSASNRTTSNDRQCNAAPPPLQLYSVLDGRQKTRAVCVSAMVCQQYAFRRGTQLNTYKYSLPSTRSVSNSRKHQLRSLVLYYTLSSPIQAHHS